MYTPILFLAMGLHIAAPLEGNATGLGVAGGVNSQAEVTIFKAGAGAFGEITGVRCPILLSIQQKSAKSMF